VGFRTDSQAQLLLVLLFFSFPLAVVQSEYGSGLGRASSNEDQQIGKVLSVRKVWRYPYFVSRYPQIHYYMLYISIRVSGQTYCSEYETPVLDEIHDVLSANGKEVEVVLRDKHIFLRTPQGRKLKVRLIEAQEC